MNLAIASIDVILKAISLIGYFFVVFSLNLFSILS